MQHKSLFQTHLIVFPDLTARDKTRGEAALKSLEQDAQLKQAKALKADGGLAEIKFHAFDVTDSSSVTSLAEHLHTTHAEGIDFIINNAGIAMDGFDANIVRTTLNCNYYKTLEACHAFLPLLKPTGKIVNVASTSGSLKKYAPSIRSSFLEAKSESDIDSIMAAFQSAVESDPGAEKDAGFPSAAYAVSKAGLIGGTRALARSSGKTVVSCCPGYVNTDMSKGNGTKSPDQGAQTPVWLALEGGDKGRFYRDEREIAWEDL
jgi:carbonyl reductase 1